MKNSQGKEIEKRVFAKIPGIGPSEMIKNSVVLIRGHGPKDSPQINYHIIRGKFDFDAKEKYGRRKRRSKFGLKKKDMIKDEDVKRLK